MDPTEDVTYLNYLRDKNSFLLQSNDVALGVQDPTLNCETIFEELDGSAHAWTIDGFPVLFNSSIITDAQDVDGKVNIEPQQDDEDSSINNVENSELQGYPVEVPSEGYITSDGLFFPNDVLLQFNLHKSQDEDKDKNEMMEIVVDEDEVYNVNIIEKQNQNSTSIRTTQTEIISNGELINIGNLNTAGNTIQLVNTDGSIININKDLLVQKKKSNDEETGLNSEVESVIAYKCKKCSLLSESSIEMARHAITCKEENPNKIKLKSILNVNQPQKQQIVLLCSVCNKGHSSTDELKKHMMEEHELVGVNVVSKIEQDPVKDKRKQDCINILKDQHKASKRVKCSVKGCDLRFALEEYRVRHEQCHVDGKKKEFKCPACDKRFSLWRLCSVHLWKCHDIDAGLLSCDSCNYKAFSSNRLLSHMLIHNDQKQFLCSNCGKSFKQFSQLRNHQVLHLDHSEGAPNWTLNKKCNLCGNIFSDSKSLKKHIQGVHNKFKPYVCNICGHKTSRKAMLELHLRQHTGEKPFSCHICPYRTGDHNSLRRHIMRHDGTKKYSCPHCNYKSIQSVAFKLHMTTKHPGLGGVYPCKHCSYVSVSKTAMQTHEKIHESASAKKSAKTSLINNTKVENEGVFNDPVTSSKNEKVDDDDETQHGFLSTSLNNDETVDTGGITIPADLEVHIVNV